MHNVGKTIRSNTIIGKTPDDFGAPDMSNARHRAFIEDCADQRRILHSEDISRVCLSCENKGRRGNGANLCSNPGCFITSDAALHLVQVTTERGYKWWGRRSIDPPIAFWSLQLRSFLFPTLIAAEAGPRLGSSWFHLGTFFGVCKDRCSSQ